MAAVWTWLIQSQIMQVIHSCHTDQGPACNNVYGDHEYQVQVEANKMNSGGSQVCHCNLFGIHLERKTTKTFIEFSHFHIPRILHTEH